MTARVSHKQRISNILRESSIPMDVENVRMRAGLKNWESTKAILLEMVLQGAIQGQKTTKSWVFWVNPNGLPTHKIKRQKPGTGQIT